MLLHRKLTRSMIGCACEVIHELGSGFLGIVVQEKVMVELKGVNTIVPEHPDHQQIILFILCIDVHQKSTRARRRDQTSES